MRVWVLVEKLKLNDCSWLTLYVRGSPVERKYAEGYQVPQRIQCYLKDIDSP